MNIERELEMVLIVREPVRGKIQEKRISCFTVKYISPQEYDSLSTVLGGWIKRLATTLTTMGYAIARRTDTASTKGGK